MKRELQTDVFLKMDATSLSLELFISVQRCQGNKLFHHSLTNHGLPLIGLNMHKESVHLEGIEMGTGGKNFLCILRAVLRHSQ